MDSSSIVKLYLREAGTPQTQYALANADGVATSAVAYAEVRAALARARRGRRIRTATSFDRRKLEFEDDWPSFFQVEATQQRIQVAGELAEKHSLSGFDAVHIATAIALRTDAPEEVQISTWDKALASAAKAEGFALAHEVTT